ncbi:uncharacterized protein LOC128551020 [Mercenaria mercenaria]|uniref:uncharacterized protein LOC128551020 n=1 Tax=Mercenaria mercenaria TaxID=6596 RepID=UPI00234EB2FE|nr:uncharacterized protein LOC128551020 [Mercenaria mercenaria]
MATRLRAVLKGQKGAVTRVFTKFETTDSEGTNFDELETIEDTLKGKLQIITDIHEQIVNSIPEENAEETEHEILDQEDYVYELRNRIQRVSIFRQVKFSNLNANSQVFPILIPEVTENRTQRENNYSYSIQGHAPTANPSYGSVYHRLPKLELPKFDGDILEWQSFWDSYECAIHNNVSLSGVQKFTYLKTSLRNEALQMIAGFSLTNSNYEKAVSHKRYGQKDIIIQSYMTALLEVPAPTHTVSSLRRFYDTTETYIRALESLNQSESTYGSLLTPVMLQKLPSDVRQNMTRAHGSQSWRLPELLSSLLSEITILDAGAPYVKRYDVPDTTSTFLTKSDSHKTEKSNSTTQRKPTSYTEKKCVYCKGHHSSLECKKVTDYKERMNIVKKNKLCLNCLGAHKLSDCRSRFKCKKCSKRHHTSICTGSESTSTETPTNQQCNAKETDSVVSHSTQTISTGTVLLKTAVSTVKSTSISFPANILFDEGSQSSFITESMARKLEIKPTGKETLSLSGFGDKERRLRHLDTAVIYLELAHEDIPVKVLIVPEISVPLATYTNQVRELSYLKGLKLAHPVHTSDDFNIEILVGADFYWTIVQDEVIRGNGPTAIQSKLGYLLSGPLNVPTFRNITPIPVSMMNVFTLHSKEEVDLEKFWKIESMGVEPVTKKQEYEQYLTHYQDTNITYNDGKYIAKLPWREEHDTLPTNELISRRRTENVINRLRKEPKLLQTYGEIIREQEQRRFIEEVPADQICTTRKLHYIPHHHVKRTRQKLRFASSMILAADPDVNFRA